MRIHLLSWLFLIPFYSILLSSIDTLSVHGLCLDEQRSLLLQMKNNLVFNKTTSTKLTKWDQTTDCCSWPGVICGGGGGGGGNSGRVVELDLSSEFITGGVDNSSRLFDLQYLQSLNLAYNSFNNSEISSGFGKLVNLTYLNMSNAGFSWQIPIEISRLTKLVTLDISNIYLLGNLPLQLKNPNLRTLIQNLSSLKGLYLDGVNVSANGYEWCPALSSSLPNLQMLSLSDCNLLGPIDSSLAKLRYLSVIRLDGNDLSAAPVPEFFGDFTNLTNLRLSSSGLNGTFPEKVFQIPTLQAIDLSENELLEGSLPELLPQNGSLQTLVLSYTNFSGKLPGSIGNLKRLSRIELSSCNFSGTIPSSMANLTQLVYLDLSLNRFTGRVPSFRLSRNLTQIMLSHNTLTGPIPSHQWEGLLNLVNVDLRNNSLSGSIPLSLFSLSSLQKIQLSNNQFDGPLSEFPNVSSHLLDTLDLSNNKLEGPVPKSVFELRGLKILSLSYNYFNGTLHPSLIRNLANLTSLDLSFNDLSIITTGNKSDSTPLPQFTTLKLASCKLSTFPNLKNQSRLITVDLSNNQIRGEIPSWVWNIGNGFISQLNLSNNMLVDFEKPLPQSTPNLSILDLHSNLFQGQIPILTSSATYLDYSHNNFSSIIPDDIGNNISYTYFFSLSNNSLTGTIPKSICNASYLQVLDLSYNSLNGTIPSCLVQKSENLGVLNLRSNHLSGTIPDTFPVTCKLQTLDFNDNKVEGPVPRTLDNCATLEVLNLGNNRIADKFPCWLKNSPNLRVLVLRANKFRGSIECLGSKSNLQTLQIVDIAFNNFSGNLPARCFYSWKAMMADVDALQSEVDHLHFEFLGLNQLYYQDAVTVTIKGLQLELVKILTVYTSIDFSSNNFEGDIPEVIGKLKSLYGLNMSSNAFTGQIPTSLGNLSQIESLDLSQNKLTGSIPIGLTSLTFLSFLNLSFNQLAGTIPRGNQFETFANTSYLGNRRLCGSPLSITCSTAEEETPTTTTEDTGSMRSGFDWQFIVTGLGFGVGAGMALAPLMFWKKGRDWYDKQVDALFTMILPLFGLVYTGVHDYRWDEDDTEHTTETELTDFTRDSYDDEDNTDQDGMEEDSFHGRYCVFCSKLDMSRKKAIHNQMCTCHSSLPISSSSSVLYFSSS